MIQLRYMQKLFSHFELNCCAPAILPSVVIQGQKPFWTSCVWSWGWGLVFCHLGVFSSSSPLSISKDFLGWVFWGDIVGSMHAVVEVMVSCLSWAGHGWCLLLGRASIGTGRWRNMARHYTHSSGQSSEAAADVPREGQQWDCSGCSLETQMDDVLANQSLDPHLQKWEFEAPPLRSGGVPENEVKIQSLCRLLKLLIRFIWCICKLISPTSL